MKIAFVTLEYPPLLVGGAGTYAEHLCSHLGLKGHDIVVFAPSSFPETQFKVSPGVRIKSIPICIRGLSSPQFWLKIRREIRKEGNFDIVHINSAAFFSIINKHLAPCPQVVTIHHLVKDARMENQPSFLQRLKDPGSENGFFLPLIERNCIKASDKVIAVSSFTAIRLIREYGLKEDEIQIIWNGRDNTPPSSSQSITDARIRCNLGSEPVILFVGRLDDPRKGFDILQMAMAQLTRKDVTLVAVGKGRTAEIEDRAYHLGIANRIRYTGFIGQSELSALYEISAVCAIPSRMEGFGFNAVQAMVMGKPIVASRVGALPEVVGVEDELVPVGDPIILAKTLDRILDDIELQKRLGTINIERAESFPTWDEVASITESVYSKMIEATRSKC
jgi:glycosyltransferase involved in cell wall biosynthesis